MSNNAPIELNKPWVCEHLRDVTEIETKKASWVLVQEPGFIGFGVVESNKISWPPHKPSGWEPDWERVSDLRLFGEKGDWHVWLDWDRKHRCRLLEFDKDDSWRIWLGADEKNQGRPDSSGTKIDVLPEDHALWGTQVKCGKESWVRLVEDRGAEIWMPPLEEFSLTTNDLPLRLKIKQLINYKPDYHLAGIVDAALIGLVRESDETLLIPAVSDAETADTNPDF